jgi:Doublecortin
MEISNHTQSSVNTFSRSNSRSSNSELEKELIDLDIGNNKSSILKKRISSSKTPTRKAKRIRFYRNGDKFYPGVTIPVSNERYRSVYWFNEIVTNCIQWFLLKNYRSFDSLAEDLARLLDHNVTLTGAIRSIYSLDGRKV